MGHLDEKKVQKNCTNQPTTWSFEYLTLKINPICYHYILTLPQPFHSSCWSNHRVYKLHLVVLDDQSNCHYKTRLGNLRTIHFFKFFLLPLWYLQKNVLKGVLWNWQCYWSIEMIDLEVEFQIYYCYWPFAI